MINTPACASCKHLHRDVYPDRTCDAFPKGIPQAMIRGENDHSQPYPGDHGIQYEFDEAFDREMLEEGLRANPEYCKPPQER